MEVFNKLVKKWSNGSISFHKKLVDKKELNDFHNDLFTIRIISTEDSNTIIVYKDFVEIYFNIYKIMASNHFDLEYNFYNIDALLELTLNGIDIELPNFRDLVLCKSRENKINAILNT